ncbi:MAG: hypothetical protein ABI844_05385 [Saprospiraceae bacterium]
MKKFSLLIILVFALLFQSCARYTGDLAPCLSGHLYGFWYGLLHGLIAPIGLFVSLFDHSVHMFAPNNNGGWYALGFLFGSGGWGILASQSSKRRKKG